MTRINRLAAIAHPLADAHSLKLDHHATASIVPTTENNAANTTQRISIALFWL